MPLASLVLTFALVAPTTTDEPPTDEPPTEPAADPDDPAELAAAAERAFGEGRFEDVVELAARAHALTGDPRHLYAQALAERRLGHCREALILYARVLASVQDDPAFEAMVADTRQGIKLCEETLEPAPEPAPKPEPTVEPTPLPPEPTSARTDRSGPRPWYRDPWGGVMLGLGVGIGAGAGGTLWGLSIREARALGTAPDEAIYAEGLADARALRTGAIVSVAVGGALLVGSIIRYALLRRRAATPLQARRARSLF